jgi:hypothetical protein
MSSKAMQTELIKAFPRVKWDKHLFSGETACVSGLAGKCRLISHFVPKIGYMLQYGNSDINLLIEADYCESLDEAIAALKASAKAQADALREIAEGVADGL